jgi:hypothetical protein
MSEVLTKIVVDCTTGVVAEIPLTSEEIAQREADAAQAESDRVAAEAEAIAKATQKAELLAKLGITEDEAKLLLG